MKKNEDRGEEKMKERRGVEMREVKWRGEERSRKERVGGDGKEWEEIKGQDWRERGG